MTSKKIKIALIKQDVYQDLYVCSREEKNSLNILFSSQGRVGPIGLMAELGADFFIVEEEHTKETQIYRQVIPAIADKLQLLKTTTLNNIPGQEFKEPGNIHTHGEFSVNCYEIDWSLYDIVISINVSLPTKLITKYPKTLFAYMIGEANMATEEVYYGYDITLNQLARGYVANDLGVVDFPYTFVKGDTLEKLMYSALQRTSLRKGVFMEINSTTERPVKAVPTHFKPLEELGYTINMHKQKIENNLQTIYDSKYFLKMGGRIIRGNSVVEAISLGTLVIMNRDEVIHSELIIDETNVKTMDEAIELIQKLDRDEKLYNTLLEKQRKIVDEFFFDKPLQSLENCLQIKQKKGVRRVFTILKNECHFIKNDIYKPFRKIKRKIKG